MIKIRQKDKFNELSLFMCIFYLHILKNKIIYY